MEYGLQRLRCLFPHAYAHTLPLTHEKTWQQQWQQKMPPYQRTSERTKGTQMKQIRAIRVVIAHLFTV